MKQPNVWGIVGILSSLITIADFVIHLFKTQKITITPLQIVAIGVAIIGFTLYFVLKNPYLKYLFLSAIHRFSHGGGPYIVKRKECIYTYLSMEEMKYEKIHELQSTVKNLTSFADQFKWSKHQSIKDIDICCKSSHKSLSLDRRENWHVYNVTFEDVAKGFTKKIHIEINKLFDPNHEAIPFLSSSITAQTHELVMKVILSSRALCPVNIWFQIFDNYAATFPCYEEKIGENCHFISYNHDANEINVSIGFPIYGYRYKIKWDFEPCS